MKVCEKCGSENSDNAKFCNNCGEDLSITSYDPEESNTTIEYDFNPNNNQQQFNSQENNFQANYQPINTKNVWIGPILNVIGGFIFYFLSGIGHFYLGLTKRGIVLCLTGLIPLIIGSILILLGDELLGSMISLVLGIALIVYSAYDAYRCAKAINSGSSIPLLFSFLDV